MSNLSAQVFGLETPLYRLDTLLNMTLTAVAHNPDDVDLDHVSVTMLMALEYMDTLKAEFAALLGATKGKVLVSADDLMQSTAAVELAGRASAPKPRAKALKVA